MKIRTILLPYDSGRRGWRMGAGPDHLLRHGAASSLRALGHDVSAEYVELDDPVALEVHGSFALYQMLAGRVRAAIDEGALPIVLSGNCGATLGCLAGVGAGTAILWLDAHGDFNTPETSASGFLDGMSLAALTGRCWQTVARTIPGFAPVPERLVIHAAGRDFDDGERAAMQATELHLVPASDVRTRGVEGALEPALDTVATRARRMHVHIDLDSLDAGRVGKANHFGSDGGLTRDQLLEIIRATSRRFEISSASLTAYDPSFDENGGVYGAAVAALEALAS